MLQQVWSPGSPVLIVGTHLEKLANIAEAKGLEERAKNKYKASDYPEVCQ